MKKIEIKVCLGTTCHLMGSVNLQTLESEIPSHLIEHVEIKWVRCLNYCKTLGYGKAPFVVIDGEVMCEATSQKIIDKVVSLLR